MKMVTRPRYYCDFCTKSGGGKHAMRVHEAHCTANPARACRMCTLLNGGSPNMPELLAAALTGDLAVLREAADGCAACMLAAIRQAPWPKNRNEWTEGGTVRFYEWDDIPEAITNWKFKDESAKAMQTIRDSTQNEYC